MNISQVLEFEGPVDALVWKHPMEDFNTTSQLIVEETHEALLVVNGNACDLFRPGRHTLETSNIPLVKQIINIPTDEKTSFPCKVFFINKVHQMDMTWGIPGEITLDDPKYDIFLHIGMCGNMNFVVSDARKFILKAVGFRDQFDGSDLVAKFRGIIKQYVKSYISKIMNLGKVSYFDMNENLFEISEVVKEQLRPIFNDYGIDVKVFNIETITVPDEDYQAVKKAKENRATRIIEGYTWQEERQMEIAKEFAGNEGTMGNIGGAVGGFMMGGAFGGSIADIARSALSSDRIPTEKPPKDLSGVVPPVDNKTPRPFDVAGFMAGFGQNDAVSGSAAQPAAASKGTPGQSAGLAGQSVLAGGPMIPSAQDTEEMKFCTSCGNLLTPDMKFCPQCGMKQSRVCPNCHTLLMQDAKFCHKCGRKC